MKLAAGLEEKAARGELANAYLLTGGPDDALAESALALAAACLCRESAPPCGVCRSCRKVEKGVHPDVSWVEKPTDKAQLGVDQIRQVRADAYIRPNEAPRKVYVVPRAYQMTDEAQNAFLKVLEEGPDYAVFLLLSPNDQALLETVRSRCETVRLALETATPDPELERKAGELAGLALGDDPWRLVAWCVPWEKAKREEVAPLWEATRQALLTYRTPRTTEKAVRLARCLDEMIAAAGKGNLGVLWGRLWAEAGR